MSYKTLLIAVAMLSPLLVGGCATNGSIYEAPASPMAISMSEFEVHIVDRRKDVEDRDLSVPYVSFPWQEDEISPPLPDNLVTLAEDVFRRNRTDGPQSLVFNIEVLNATQRFVADTFSETETIAWELVLEVSQTSGPKQIFAGSANGKRTSLDASRKRIREMFVAGFQSALEDALSKYANILSQIAN